MSAALSTNPLASTPVASNPLIEARGLHTYYGESHVLHGVDLRLMHGETLSLMGRNGMGKTTTLKSILGFVPPRQGEVSIKGKSTAKRRPWQLIRQGIGYVPEGRGIFPGISVREHLIMAARPNERGESPWTLERVLDTFPRLGQRINHDGSFLSGGEQQMLSIGRALTTNPDMIILDEATEGLAPLIRDEIWKIIREIKASGIASIIVDKNIDNLLEVADRHLLLVKGEVVYSGDSQGLREDPSILDIHLGVA